MNPILSIVVTIVDGIDALRDFLAALTRQKTREASKSSYPLTAVFAEIGKICEETIGKVVFSVKDVRLVISGHGPVFS